MSNTLLTDGSEEPQRFDVAFKLRSPHIQGICPTAYTDQRFQLFWQLLFAQDFTIFYASSSVLFCALLFCNSSYNSCQNPSNCRTLTKLLSYHFGNVALHINNTYRIKLISTTSFFLRKFHWFVNKKKIVSIWRSEFN